MEMNNVYVAHAERLLGACLARREDVAVKLLISSGLRSADLPEMKHWHTYDAIVRALRESKPLDPETIAAIDTSLELVWLRGIANTDTPSMLEGSIDVVISHADERAINMAVDAIVQQRGSASPQEMRSFMMTAAASTRRNNSVPLGIGDILNEPPVMSHLKPVKTNIEYFDSIFAGGLSTDTSIAIGAPEKNRKTTMARNLLLSLLRDGDGNVRRTVSAAFCAFENGRHITANDFLAMIVIERIMKLVGRNDLNKVVRGRLMHQYADATWLMREMPSFDMSLLPHSLRLSIEYAQDTMQSLNPYLRIYDRSREGGNLGSVTGLGEKIVEHDTLYRNNDQLLVVVVDYLQLVSEPKMNKFESQTYLTNMLLGLAADRQAAIISIAQYTRSSTRDRAKGEDIGIIPVDSNPDLARAVQFFFEVSVNKNAPESMDTQLVAARRHKVGKSMSIRIHPDSGLMLPELTREKGAYQSVFQSPD